MHDLVNLPWQIQVALACGFIGYLMAYTGVKSHHRVIDTTLITVIFSLIPTGILAVVSNIGNVTASLSALLGSIICGVVWRKWGQALISACMRRLNVSWANDDPSALATLSRNSKFPVSQIGVLLDNGTWLLCNDTAKFNDAPYGPCLLGPNGDVALYLTHEETGGEAKELKSVRDAEFGDRITYVPASKIQRITFRHLPKA